ncbi:hypothetical protein ACLOJK_037088 [Asimina triloba]
MDYKTAFRSGCPAPHCRAKVPRSRNRASGPPYAPAQARLRRRSGSTSGARNFAHRRPDGTCSMSLEMARRDLRRGQPLGRWASPPGPNIAAWRPNGATLGHSAVWLRGLSSANLTGAIIPALMHRIPSELRN